MAEEKAAPAGKAEPKKKELTRQPSALKRDIQKRKTTLTQCSYRSSVFVCVRSFETSLEKKEAPEIVKTKLSNVYRLDEIKA